MNTPPADADALLWLQGWFAEHCDGDWEHGYGVRIETLDNPGWRLRVDLGLTELESQLFDSLEIQRSETDWLHCRVEQGQFSAAGGAGNLLEIVGIFRRWAEQHSDE